MKPDIKGLARKAEKIIKLGKQIDDAMKTSTPDECMKIAIMAGLKDAYNQGFNHGYCSRPA